MHKVLFWSGFGVAVRFWQLGIELRPFFDRTAIWAYPVFAAAGGSFGYWMMGVSERQNLILEERKENLLAKRRRRAEREGTSAEGKVAEGGVHSKPVSSPGKGGLI